ncbi:MAG: hypothetical protein IK095_07690, partial [Oscillospiraceae bacterium]|nr:hypothetical protein [Oscillospiraceae bacterium]
MNQIWNAAEDYSLAPDVKAYDSEGNADIYWNSILGAARRIYDYPKLAAVFRSIQQYEDADTYEGLLWLGLENAIFQRESADRPVLARLRRDHAERFLQEYGALVHDDYHLYDYLALSHFRRALGQDPVMGSYDRKLLDELEFTADLDTDAIVERAEDLFRRWFQISLEEKKRSRKPLFPKLRKKKGDQRFHKFWIGYLDRPAHAYTDDSGVRFDEQPRTSMSEAELRTFMEYKYGAPIYSEKESRELEQRLCTGDHANCHLLFTKGDAMPGKIQNGFEALHREQERKQIERNRSSYRQHLSQHRTAIERLANRIQNSVLLYLQPSTIRSDTGAIEGGRVWRAMCLDDPKVFQRTEQGDMGDLRVDILLDASTSQSGRQEAVSAQGYMIAQALTRCRIPCRVMSFCSMTGFTILRIFRDHDAPQDNEKIFEYVSNGCNRDGLAIRAAHELMRSSPCEHKILIVLSDVKPHDSMRIASDEGSDISGYRPYENDAAVRDSAREVRSARADGIAVICIFTG